jgi:DNA-binding NarL/FixJ family response regulator
MQPVTEAIKVVIAEDDTDILEMLQTTLEMLGVDVVGSAVNGREAIDEVTRLSPDIILLDMHMPEMLGLEAIPEIVTHSPRTKIVVHSAIGATFMTDQALKLGAHAYIEKGVKPRTIVEHIGRVHLAGAVRPVQPYPLRRNY